jgi:DNA-binding XRE family transcriptional regulator
MPRKPTKGAAIAPTLNPGEQIRAARIAAGWSQAELGRRLNGVTRQRVQQIESWAPRSRPDMAWFLSHQEVWAELGLGPELVASFYQGVCPHCRRPF